MIIYLNKNFYKLSDIKNAVKAYEHLAAFEIEEQKQKYKIVVKKINSGITKLIEDEFLNYILAKMKNE